MKEVTAPEFSELLENLVVATEEYTIAKDDIDRDVWLAKIQLAKAILYNRYIRDHRDTPKGVLEGD